MIPGVCQSDTLNRSRFCLKLGLFGRRETFSYIYGLRICSPYSFNVCHKYLHGLVEINNSVILYVFTSHLELEATE